MNETIRLDAYLSSQGIGARRKIPYILASQKIMLNDVRVIKPGIRIDPKKDTLTINGKKIYQPHLEYILLNKPLGIISSAKDELRRKTVTDLVRSRNRLFPIGRLDKDTTGLIILTNDGDFANLLTHPRYHVPKTYQLYIQGSVNSMVLKRFRSGVELEEGKTAPCEATILSSNEKVTMVRVVLYQGWKRQIRRMCEKLGLNLTSLERVAIGSVRVGNVQPGQFRLLTPKEIGSLTRSAKGGVKKEVEKKIVVKKISKKRKGVGDL